MKYKNALTVFFLLPSIVISSNVLADWNGYVNKTTLGDRPYGYLTTTSFLSDYRKVRLVCLPPNEYRLYLDETINEEAKASEVVLVVDQMPPASVTVERVGENVLVTNQSLGFWTLIAQMSAGAKLTVTTGDGAQHGYSLIGFTKSYLNNCGWMKSSSSYQAYLNRYR